MNNKKKVLVTGINGFIGSHIADRLYDEGYEVHGIDRFVGQGKHVTDVFDIVHEDMTKYIYELKPDIIINCAGQANVPNSILHPDDDFQENVSIVHKLLFSIKESGLTEIKFLQLSSAAVYGDPQKLPILENSDKNPLSPYAMHKVMAEDICKYFWLNYGFDITVLRIFSVYGPGLRKQIFWDLYQKVKKTGKMSVIGTGDESRDYIYIDDLVEAIIIALESEDEELIWNVASGKEIFIKDVVRIYAKELGLKCEDISFSGDIRLGDPVNWCADIGILKKNGFEPKTDISEGIKKYVDWICSIDV